MVENEGPPGLFQAKFLEKLGTMSDELGQEWADNVFFYAEPWGGFSFADARARERLAAYCDEHAIDAVVANPTLGLGVSGAGRPDETQMFVDCPSPPGTPRSAKVRAAGGEPPTLS
jgi:hypothetical protein